ncbi:SulP family inorganic anion transporter [Paucibacter sp. APW11]|uniref:SulP family inorganic anion transporter n=1 Tax=Roseateles aquae TaxID=3077235 RepID=A0ABU3PFK8_9BURK|nr:SulP family inorganic anion transporter [Paucibacter sp. APW11]MDT9001107.1 SulP family inorganic anion transporter [Paucibacter sp. APW11]
MTAAWLQRWRAYAGEFLHEDLLAAFVVSVLLIPQSLAYAMLAGLPAQTGMYASLLPLLLYALLGSSPYLGIGPVAVLALMIAQTLGQAPAGVSPGEAALVLAAEVGLILAAAAALRLDALAALLSVPVLHGFETGATLSIAAAQLPVLLGSPASGFDLPSLLGSAMASGGQWHRWSAAFGVGAVCVLVFGRQGLAALLGRWMGEVRAALLLRLLPLVLLLLAMSASRGLDAVSAGVAVVGELPPLHLGLSLPRLDAALWQAMLPGALLLALMAYVTSLVVSESLARRRAERVDARRELLGLAGANLAAALSLGMPVAASFSRSVLLYDAGSRTRMSGVFIAFAMGLAMWLLAPLLAWLPKAVLAATILVAVLSGLKFAPFAQAWRYARAEAVLMGLVTLLVLFWSVSAALGLGVLGAIALLLQRTARPHVALIGRVPGTEHYRNMDRYQVECLPGVMGLRIDESLLFTNARSLTDVVQALLEQQPDTRRVVLQMAPVNAVDFSGLEALRDLHEALRRQDIRLDLSEVKGPVLDRLKASAWQHWFRGQLFLSHHQGMLDGSRVASDWVSP